MKVNTVKMLEDSEIFNFPYSKIKLLHTQSINLHLHTLWHVKIAYVKC